MLGNLFSNSTFSLLEKGLDASALRHQAIANNIANINTPGYKKLEVSFEEEFKRAKGSGQIKMAQLDNRHLPGPGLSTNDINITTSSATSMRNDGNNVDIDEEVTKMSENNIRFNAMSKLLADRFRSLRIVIEGRG